jgi:hypothetical protein
LKPLFLGDKKVHLPFFFRDTAPPWERKARPVVMEFEETKMDSVTQPNHQGLARPEIYREAEGHSTHRWESTQRLSYPVM